MKNQIKSLYSVSKKLYKDLSIELILLFVVAKTYSSEEFRATIYGTYHFTYEFRESGIGIGDNQIFWLVSCPDPIQWLFKFQTEFWK